MDYLAIFKKYGINFTQNIQAFTNHMEELKKRIQEKVTLNITYEPWMAQEISEKNWKIAQRFLAEVFQDQVLPEIEVFLVSTYVTMQEGKEHGK